VSVVGIILVCFVIAVVVGVAGALMRKPPTDTEVPVGGQTLPPPIGSPVEPVEAPIEPPGDGL